VGADNGLTNLEVVETICDLVDQRLADHQQRRQLIAQISDRPGHDRRYAVCTDKVHNATGWQPEIRFSTGLRETVAWYLDNQPWVEQLLASEAD
jgi:dTDP-glucose 4,6-dehydratase